METTDIENPTVIREHTRLVDFEAQYRKSKPNQAASSIAANLIKSYVKNLNIKKSFLCTFPIIETLASYDVRDYLINDVIAGIMVGVTIIPQSMAFATLSTLPPEVGLYMSFFAPLTYIVFGTSRHLAWGCVAIVSLMMSNIMDKYDQSNNAKEFILQLLNNTHHYAQFNSHELEFPFLSNENEIFQQEYILSKIQLNSSDNEILEIINHRRIEVASGVTVISGFIFIIASFVGFSRISVIMSSSLITGFTVGVSFHIATSQMKGIFGLTLRNYKGTGKIFRIWAAILGHITESNLKSLLISFVCIFVIYLVKRCVNERYKHKLRVPIPIELFVVIIGILLSFKLGFFENKKVNVVGKVPSGMPKPKFPDLSLIPQFIGDGLVIMVVSYAQSLAMAKTLALEFNYGIDSKQEMVACGICSAICGLFSGYIPGGSVSLSLIQSNAGGKSLIASIFSASIVLLVILVLGPYVKYLPTCVISAIIFVNLRSMFSKLFLVPNVWRTSKYDCAVWVFACVSTIILETGTALFVSIAFSLFLVILRMMVRPVTEIGQINTCISSVELRTIENYDCVQTLQNVKLIKVKTPVLFFNSDSFTTSVFAKIKIDLLRVKTFQNSISRTRIKSSYKTLDDDSDCDKHENSIDVDINEALPILSAKTVVLDISEVAFIDVMGVQAFESIIRELKSINIEVLMTSVPENVFNILQSTGFWKKHSERLFLNVPAALASLDPTVDRYNSCGKNMIPMTATEN